MIPLRKNIFPAALWCAAVYTGCSPAPAHVPRTPAQAGETVWIEGGTFDMGDTALADASPTVTQQVDGFRMHRYEVTRIQFRAFTEQTGYVTLADRNGGSYVFDAGAEAGPRSIPGAPWWRYVPGAGWQSPGKTPLPAESGYLPATHIAYEDACAYCAWLDMRLPTEAKWEWAARGDGDKKDKNIWQGNFPYENKRTDGFEGPSPVGSFPPGKNGLYDMAGNVWEWCADPYNAYWYGQAGLFPPGQRVHGPAKGYDPSSPYEETRVIRGGSFLCSDSYCTGYRPGTRMRSSVSLTFGHIGFRCVSSARQ